MPFILGLKIVKAAASSRWRVAFRLVAATRVV